MTARPLLLILLPLTLLAPVAGAGDRAPVAYVIVDGRAVPAPLSREDGDAARGGALAGAEGCADCHDGTAAPDLAEAAGRLEAGELRLAVVDFSARDPQIVGHAWYDVIVDPEQEDAVGETPLTANEIEDLVAWLASLRPAEE